MKTVYTLGYSKRTPAEVEKMLDRLGAVLFDIRFSPRSRNPAWSKKNLTALLDERYQHVKPFGNKNFKGGPIELLNFNEGLDIINSSERPVILMCVCEDYNRCHRKTVAEMLAEHGYVSVELGRSHKVGNK